MADRYTVFMYDWCTFTKLATLPAAGLTFGSQLNAAGSCQFSLNLSDPGTARRYKPMTAYQGVPPACFIDRDGTIVWGGFIYAGNYSGSKQVLQLSGKEFSGYFDQRIIAKDYSAATFASGIDPAKLVFDAITDAVAKTGSWDGFTVVGGTSSVPKIVPGYSVNQYCQVSQVISDQTAASTPGFGGVDLTVTSAWSGGLVGGTPVVTMSIDSPRAGRAAGFTGLIFNLMEAIDWTWPWDSSQSGTDLIVTGTGTGTTQPAARALSSQPVGGLGQYPLTELVQNYNQVQEQSQIQRVADGAAQVYGQAIVTPTAVFPADYPPNGLGSWLIGDDARLYCPGGQDPMFPDGLDQYWRIVAHTVNVPDAGLPDVTLTFNQPPIF